MIILATTVRVLLLDRHNVAMILLLLCSYRLTLKMLRFLKLIRMAKITALLMLRQIVAVLDHHLAPVAAVE